MAVQGNDVERHRGDVHSEPLGVGQQEAEGAAELPLSLQSVDEGEGEAQRVDQQVGCRRARQEVNYPDRFKQS